MSSMLGSRLGGPPAAPVAIWLLAVVLTACEFGEARTDPEPQPTLPITAVFFVPGDEGGPFHPSPDRSPAGDVAALEYANIDAGIVPWDGPGSAGDRMILSLMEASDETPVRWAASIRSAASRGRLERVTDRLAIDPAYLRVDDRPVVFVQGPGSCERTRRWVGAAGGEVFLLLHGFDRARGCRFQPDLWYRVAPGQGHVAEDRDAFSISPGAWSGAGPPTLSRDVDRWRRSVLLMEASPAPFHLITTYDGWSDGTAIASAREWESGSGFGVYLDVLHGRGLNPLVAPEIAAAGDISCDPRPKERSDRSADSGPQCLSQETSDLLTSRRLAAVLALGDTQYEDGTIEEYRAAYDSTWGRLKHITLPVTGNHEYTTPGAPGYFEYFGDAAGDPNEGWYSADVGGWHLIGLNSNCDEVGGCEAGSPQERWLRQDLAANPRACTLAFWHHPRFSTGTEGESKEMGDLWTALQDAGADVVLAGHDHAYERFAPLLADGTIDRSGGIRSFVVGTGGRSTYRFRESPAPATEARAAHYGVLFLRLQPDGYSWRFEPIEGETFRDHGSDVCHV